MVGGTGVTVVKYLLFLFNLIFWVKNDKSVIGIIRCFQPLFCSFPAWASSALALMSRSPPVLFLAFTVKVS